MHDAWFVIIIGIIITGADCAAWRGTVSKRSET
jgi:hypothetical protein